MSGWNGLCFVNECLILNASSKALGAHGVFGGHWAFKASNAHNKGSTTQKTWLIGWDCPHIYAHDSHSITQCGTKLGL